MKLKSIFKYQLFRRIAISLTALVGLTFGSQLYAGYYYGGYGHHYGGYGYGGHGHRSSSYGYRGHGLHGFHHGGFYNNGYPHYGYSYNFYGPTRFNSGLYNVQPTYGKLSVAWRHLSIGKTQLAKDKFIKLATKSPKSGLPKVGISLAAAFSEDYMTAAYAMRRAFALDPVGASDLPSRPALRGKIRTLALHYREIVNSNENSDVDAVFMFAALSHLLNDYETAKAAVQDAIDLGDDSSSAENLKKLLV